MNFNNNFKKDQIANNQFGKDTKPTFNHQETKPVTTTEEVKVETTLPVEEVTTTTATETTLEAPVENNSDQHLERNKNYRSKDLILKLLEFAFIFSLILLPCFVARVPTDSDYIFANYNYLNVIFEYVELIIAGGFLAIAYDILKFYLTLTIIVGAIRAIVSLAKAYKNRHNYEVNKEEFVEVNNKNKKIRNNVSNITVSLIVIYVINLIEYPVLAYVQSYYFYSVNLLIIVPVAILIAYIVYYLKVKAIKKDILNVNK